MVNMAISMELDTVDSAFEKAAALSDSLRHVLLETQKSLQEFVANQQTISALKKQVNNRLQQHYHQIKQIEEQTREINGRLQKTNVLQSVRGDDRFKIIILTDGLVIDIRRTINTHQQLRAKLEEMQLVTFLSFFSTKRILKKTNESLGRIYKYTHSMRQRVSQVIHFKHEDYEDYQKNKLKGIAAFSGEKLTLSPESMESILASIEAPISAPSTAMQRALERHARFF